MATLGWAKLQSNHMAWASKGIPAIYEHSCQVPTWSHRTSCFLSLVVRLVTQSSDSQKVNGYCACCQWIQLESSSPSLSFTLTLQSGSSASRLFPRLRWSTRRRGHQISWNIRIWMRSFAIYGKWSVQTSIDTHTCSNYAVTLVWGSLRLAPINIKKGQKQDFKNIKNVKGCRDGMPKSMQTR